MMKKLILGAAAAVATLTAGGAAMAQPYGYYRGDNGYSRDYRGDNGYSRDYRGYGYDRDDWRYTRYGDRDRDGIPDRWDRYDNRYDGYRHGRRHHHHEW